MAVAPAAAAAVSTACALAPWACAAGRKAMRRGVRRCGCGGGGRGQGARVQWYSLCTDATARLKRARLTGRSFSDATCSGSRSSKSATSDTPSLLSGVNSLVSRTAFNHSYLPWPAHQPRSSIEVSQRCHTVKTESTSWPRTEDHHHAARHRHPFPCDPPLPAAAPVGAVVTMSVAAAAHHWATLLRRTTAYSLRAQLWMTEFQ